MYESEKPEVQGFQKIAGVSALFILVFWGAACKTNKHGIKLPAALKVNAKIIWSTIN